MDWFNADQMNIIWNAAKNTKNQGEVAVYKRIAENSKLASQFTDIELNIIDFCAQECKRQMSGNMSVYNLVNAWVYAESLFSMNEEFGPEPKLNLDFIEEFGKLTEPMKNIKGYRTIRIGIQDGLGWIEKAPPDRVIPQLNALLYSYYSNLLWTPINFDHGWGDYGNSHKLSQSAEDEFYYKYEEIHPFVDGNGRTGKIIYNYLKGTLTDPQMPPNFWGAKNP